MWLRISPVPTAHLMLAAIGNGCMQQFRLQSGHLALKPGRFENEN